MNTLLIANRGEIALRVMRTAKRLGWECVAIHTDLDVDALHVRAADRAVLVGSYLDIDEVVAAARGTGAGYVHPGYGFLSERAPFARALADAGITLVGPSADVMDAMGRKDAAREVAVAAGVPVVPSYSLDDDPGSFSYPVLVKAAAGGGGKGMRVVRSASEYDESFAAAQREGRSSFGDDTMLVEKYVESGRHIEVQVLGDSHGTVLHFFERDCSTQRRHQKVLEEAPAPTISEERRAAITASAVALATQCGYTGAGTVEFLLDNATGEFYFLEMNTRLQVEHPVTEEVVRVAGERVDLVELQLLVAAGEPLPFAQDAITLDGHAIEARVYAEDSFHGFLPQAGIATDVSWPTTMFAEGVAPHHDHDTGAVVRRIRVDHALESGQEVSTSFDPMLGKVISWAATREEAAHGAGARAGRHDDLRLDHQHRVPAGPGRLRRVPGRHRGHGVAGPQRGARAGRPARPRAGGVLPRPGPARQRRAVARGRLADGWRTGGRRRGGRPAGDDSSRRRRRSSGPSCRTSTAAMEAAGSAVDLDGVRHAGVVRAHPSRVEVVLRGQRFLFVHPDPFADTAAAAGDGTLVAPMPGTVLAVNVAEGESVSEGATLGVMEAMKMELALKAPFAGTVTSVGASVGDLVRLGAALFTVEPTDD